MNNPNNRATRAIVASGSLVAIIFIALPWVDEYLRLRNDAAELVELETKFAESLEQSEQLDRVEAKLANELKSYLNRSVDPTNTEGVRETLIEFVRQAGGRIRRLEIAKGQSRPWAIKNDHPRNTTTPRDGERSRFVLHTHSVELQINGSLDSINQILESVYDQGWLMTTKGLTIEPSGIRESPTKLEMRLVLYGLGPVEAEQDEDFAQLNEKPKLR